MVKSYNTAVKYVNSWLQTLFLASVTKLGIKQVKKIKPAEVIGLVCWEPFLLNLIFFKVSFFLELWASETRKKELEHSTGGKTMMFIY